MTDPAAGLYIHAADEHHGLGARVLRITIEGEEQVWVHADDFMAVQKERDDLRREWAMLNAQVCMAQPHVEVRKAASRALERLGFTAGDGEAMIGLMRWARSEPRT